MFKFGGFKASLKLGSSSKKKEIYDDGADSSVAGAYRTHREEFLGRNGQAEPPRIRVLSPSMVKLPQPSLDKELALKTSKSTNDLANPYNIPPQLRKSSLEVSTDPRGGTSNNRDSSALNRKVKANGKEAKRDPKKQEKELREIEKKRVAEQRRKDKLAAQEQARQDKLRIQRDREIAQQQAREVKLRKEQEKHKKKAPQPPQTSNPQAIPSNSKGPIESQIPIPPQRSNPLGQRSNYSTNTLESSISRSSGPPAYSAAPEPQPNTRDDTGNTSFGRPIEESSWDLISEHRNQISRKVATGASGSKQMMIDLQFSFEKAQLDEARNNSDV